MIKADAILPSFFCLNEQNDWSVISSFADLQSRLRFFRKMDVLSSFWNKPLLHNRIDEPFWSSMIKQLGWLAFFLIGRSSYANRSRSSGATGVAPAKNTESAGYLPSRIRSAQAHIHAARDEAHRTAPCLIFGSPFSRHILSSFQTCRLSSVRLRLYFSSSVLFMIPIFPISLYFSYRCCASSSGDISTNSFRDDPITDSTIFACHFISFCAPPFTSGMI